MIADHPHLACVQAKNSLCQLGSLKEPYAYPPRKMVVGARLGRTPPHVIYKAIVGGVALSATSPVRQLVHRGGTERASDRRASSMPFAPVIRSPWLRLAVLHSLIRLIHRL